MYFLILKKTQKRQQIRNDVQPVKITLLSGKTRNDNFKKYAIIIFKGKIKKFPSIIIGISVSIVQISFFIVNESRPKSFQETQACKIILCFEFLKLIVQLRRSIYRDIYIQIYLTIIERKQGWKFGSRIK